MDDNEFTFLVNLAQKPSEERNDFVNAHHPPVSTIVHSSAAKDVLERLLGRPVTGHAAIAWHDIIKRAASGGNRNQA